MTPRRKLWIASGTNKTVMVIVRQISCDKSSMPTYVVESMK